MVTSPHGEEVSHEVNTFPLHPSWGSLVVARWAARASIPLSAFPGAALRLCRAYRDLSSGMLVAAAASPSWTKVAWSLGLPAMLCQTPTGMLTTWQGNRSVMYTMAHQASVLCFDKVILCLS